VADSDPPLIAQLLTRTGLRKLADSLDISLPFNRIDHYIEVGVLPDPEEEPWTKDELTRRLIAFRELQSEGTSLDRRVVWLYTDRFPVPPPKLQRAMAGMLPTIKAPKHKMLAIQRANGWFSNLPSNKTSIFGAEPRLPPAWKLPSQSEWAEVLLSADTDVFWSRLGALHYYCSVLEFMAKDSPHALVEIPKAERLALMTVDALARMQAVREYAVGSGG
jgi:hypothetical protein